MSFILWALLFYIAYGLGMYIYAVIVSFSITDVWQFRITDNSIGVLKYPKWVLWWLRAIVKEFTNGK